MASRQRDPGRGWGAAPQPAAADLRGRLGVDLPHLSVIVMGLDDWNTGYAEAVTEDRLLAAVRHHLGSQVAALRTPPVPARDRQPVRRVGPGRHPGRGVPALAALPRCFLLAPIASGLFTLKA